MLATRFTCPHCAHHLHSDHSLAAGMHVKCPHCGTHFRATPAGAKRTGTDPGRGILLAWLLFLALLMLVGGGILLTITLSNKEEPQQGSADIPEPKTALLTPSSTPPVDPPVPPATRAKTIPRPTVKEPAEDTPPSLPVPPPRTEPARPRVDTPPQLPSVPQGKQEPAEPPQPKPPKQPDPIPRPAKPSLPARMEAPQIHWLLPRERRLVDKAVDHGIAFLRREQHADGTWGNQAGEAGQGHTPGITALASLTLLECGVRANDPQVQLAAQFLRAQMPDLNATYSISLALLFFDRLGEPQDIPRIRTLALRLIAGQKPSGGWDYSCPLLGDNEELGLLALLHKDRPRSSLELFLTQMDKQPGLESMTSKDSAKVGPGVAQVSRSGKLKSDLYRPQPSPVPPLDLFITQAPDSGATTKATTSPTPQPAKDLSAPPPAEESPSKPEASDKPASPPPREEPANSPAEKQRLSDKALVAAEKLSPELKKTPALNSAELLRGKPNDLIPRTDNSNTQFAILGLLAAERYDVPLERVIALIDWRFRGTQVAPGGTWHYQTKMNTSPAMTGAGLLGLALKHGLLLPNPQNRGRHVLVRDPLIQTSFNAWSQELTRYLVGYVNQETSLEKLDLYVLWTMERVAVLYDRRKIGNLEWYGLGVRLLLPLQQANGSWSPAAMLALNEPAVSTSFALLFLKRSNLARDLTHRLNPVAEK